MVVNFTKYIHPSCHESQTNNQTNLHLFLINYFKIIINFKLIFKLKFKNTFLKRARCTL